MTVMTMISDTYDITRIPDLTLNKYAALDESGVDGVLKKHLVFLRHLHRVILLQKGLLHWIYKYSPDAPKGKKLRIFLKIDRESDHSFPSEDKNNYKNIFVTHSPLSPYFDINPISKITEESEKKIINETYEYMAVLIKKEKFVVYGENEKHKDYRYSVNEWKINEDARLYDLLKILQSVNQPCVYCVDVQPVDYVDQIDGSEMLGPLMEKLRRLRDSRFDKSANESSPPKITYDENTDYML